LGNDLEIGDKQIGSIPDLVENNPDRRGLMGGDVNESSDSSSSSALPTSSTSFSDEETDSEQNTTTKHVTSQDVYNDNQGEDNGNSDDGTSTEVDGSVALDSINADVDDAAPSDAETLQIQESSRYCRLPSQRITMPSRSAQLIYHGIFTSFQQHALYWTRTSHWRRRSCYNCNVSKSFSRITIISCNATRRCYRGVNP
jgi:hypothetical protein